MIFLDGTQWDDRESVNVPPGWNLEPLRFLYNKDFYADCWSAACLYQYR
jgi:hypothetical protein